MATTETGFYTSGGTLAPDAPSYITRDADHDLIEGLRDGRFCYVLASRQMGKSSLRNRTAKRLRDVGAAVAELDLTAIGRNLSAQQWYDGLVYELGRELGLKAQLNACWLQNTQLGPLHRLMCVLLEGVLSETSGQVVIFIDEIEVVRSLSFSTDEFFAAIRACFNLRGSDPNMQRLSFCLLGMAVPSDLIRDTRITPFNIGLRIELTDFTTDEARVLAAGLGQGGRDGEMLLDRVLHWTGGHPYLTQRVCQAVAGTPEVVTGLEVDMIVADLFLSTRARESDANLVPVREFLLRSSEDVAGTLDLYRRVRSNRRVEYDETNPLIRTLNLSGITHVESGCLRVRNRIYAHVFDLQWVAVNMPDAEVTRQRAAFRKGWLRAAAIAAFIIAIMGGLVWEAVKETHRADTSAALASQQEQRTNRLLYADDMYATQSALERHDVASALKLLDYHRNDADRGFEYGYLWQMCHQELFTYTGLASTVYGVAFSPDSKLLAAATNDGTVVVLDAQTNQLIQHIQGKGALYTVAFSPNGKWLAFAGDRGTLSIVETATWREIPTHSRSDDVILAMAFSPDGEWLATAGGTDTVKIWTTAKWSLDHELGKNIGGIHSIAFSPDGRLLAAGGANGPDIRNGKITLWSLRTRREIREPLNFGYEITCVAFAPNGLWLAAGGGSRTVELLDTKTFRSKLRLDARTRNVCSMDFARDSQSLSLACEDRTIKILSLASAREVRVLDGHTSTVSCVAFSPDGKWLASGGWDNTARIWNARTVGREHRISLKGSDTTIRRLFSRDGMRLITSNAMDDLQVWDATDGAPIGKKLSFKKYVMGIAFTANCRHIAIATDPNAIRLIDPATSQTTRLIRPPIRISGAFDFSPDGSLLAVADAKHNVRVWKIGATDTGQILDGPAKPVTSVAFSPDGKRIAAGYDDRTVMVWQLNDLPHSFHLIGLDSRVSTVAFSPDGLSLATGTTDSEGSSDGVVTLWNLGTQRRTLIWTGDTKTKNTAHDTGPAAAFYSNGDVLATMEGSDILLRRSSAPGR